MVGVHVIKRRRGVHIVDHRDRKIVKPDIFAQRRARRVRGFKIFPDGLLGHDIIF
jgi:hypothetical protein